MVRVLKHKLTIFVILLLFSISIASAELKLGAKTDGFHPVLYTGTITPMDNSTYSVAFNLYSVPYLYLAQSTSDNSYSIYPGVVSQPGAQGRAVRIIGGQGGPTNPPAIEEPGDGGEVYIYGGYGASYGNTILAHDGTTAKGYVGIGKNNPSSMLDVAGTIRATAFIGNGSQLTGLPQATQWTNQTGVICYGDTSSAAGNEPVCIHAGGAQYLTSNAYWEGNSWLRFKQGYASAISYSDSGVSINVAKNCNTGTIADFRSGLVISATGDVIVNLNTLPDCELSQQ